MPRLTLGIIGRIKAVWYVFRDPQTPTWAKLAFGLAAIVYFASPIDLLPELFFGPLGLLDDMVVLPLLMWLFTKFAPDYVRRRAEARAAGKTVDQPTTP